ncbi:MAG: HAMP domain-containing sensor histidine kinase [Pseudomonadota bacterium]
MKRLYLKLYLALVAVLFTAGIVSAVVMHFAPIRHSGAGRLPQIAARALWHSLPSPGDPEFERALEQRANELDIDVAVYHEAHGLRAEAAREPLPRFDDFREGFRHAPGGVLYLLPVEGPYWLAARDRAAHRPRFARGLAMLGAFAVLLGVACYPVARAMTRRLESLEQAVEQWGTGKLSRRVPVEGRDEIAVLAASFNRAAERIERLVAAQRGVLANASHELRSPLARLRVALELVNDEPAPEERRRLIAEANRDIDALNDLVEEVLEAARSEAHLDHGMDRAPVDFDALVREEAARYRARIAIAQEGVAEGNRECHPAQGTPPEGVVVTGDREGGARSAARVASLEGVVATGDREGGARSVVRVAIAESDVVTGDREEAAPHPARPTVAEGILVTGDARLLRRLVRNLLENAARYAPESPIDVELSRVANTVELAVRDRGPGIPESDRERVFLPFYRPAGHREGVHGGVGLGLSLVKQIAEAHHGSVTYAPRPGGGACFVVRLPAG